MDIKQPFQIGQKVRPSSEYVDRYCEWQGIDLWVAGIRFSPASGGFEIDVTERWPPLDRGDITDGWTELDLFAA